MAETAIGALAVKITADLGDLVDGFNRADKAVDKFTRQLDRRVTEPLAKIVAAAGAAGAAVFAFAKGAADAVDELGKLSQKVGISVEALSGLTYASKLSNVSVQDFGQGLKQLSKFMVENNVTGVSTEEQLLRIADEFAQSKDGAEKTAAAMKYFGKSGADLIPLLNQGRAGIEELRKEAARLGVVFSTEAAKKAEEFNDNLTRLQSAAQGLHVELAGPLVEALNKTAKAMLDAKRDGESLFGALLQGFRTLVTGDDAHKWNVEFTKAVEDVLKAQDKIDAIRRQPGWMDPFGKGLADATKELKKAQENVARLQAIKPILAPEPPAAPDKPKTGTVTVPQDAGKAQAEAERMSRIFEEQAEEEARIRSEASALADQQRQKELELQRAARELDLQEHEVYGDLNIAQLKAQQDERIRVLIESYDREQEAAIENGEAILAAEGSHYQRSTQMRAQYLASTQSFLGNMASLMNTSSRRTFEIGKAFAIADAGVRTASAVISAFDHGSRMGGYWLGIAMAAAAAAAGLNMMNNLRAQSFGGGGGPPAPAGQGSSGVAAPSAAPATGGGESEGGQLTVLELHGDVFSADGVRKLVAKLNEGRRAGDRIIIR